MKSRVWRIEYIFYLGRLGYLQEAYLMGSYLFVRRRFGWWGYDYKVVFSRPYLRILGFSAGERYVFQLSIKNMFKRFAFVARRARFVELEHGVFASWWEYGGGDGWRQRYLGARGLAVRDVASRLGGRA